MKRRVASTYKILAVAAVAAGCSTSSQPPASPERPSVVANVEEPDKNVGEGSDQDVVPAVVSGNETPPPPLPPGPKASLHPDHKAQLNTLLAQMLDAPKADVDAQTSHFRPLCDDLGYPLVGNVQRKGSPEGYQPSEFCAQVRAKKPR